MAAYTQDVVLLLGDSLTQGRWDWSGFADRLACMFCGLHLDQPLKPRLATYVRKFDVINRGLSGYQTDWAIPVFEQVIRR
jgi:hypothetical protein